eukprot:GHVL01000943.1.p1 GENE.GHVL01000943.1~~GHVL01000943.1.p1  ORF type:complete len:168 (-),score=18.20 GHVL01000943.1:813-1316(-)
MKRQIMVTSKSKCKVETYARSKKEGEVNTLNIVFNSGLDCRGTMKSPVIRPQVQPMLRQIGPHAVPQDDNAPPHRARLVEAFLQQVQINRMDWPAKSPDMNPIEHAWEMLGRRVRENHAPPANLQQLLVLLQPEWQAIPQANLANIVHSMRDRCNECCQNRGGYTHY